MAERLNSKTEPASSEKAAEAEGQTNPSGKSWKSWLPLAFAIVAAPLISFGLAQFVLLPQFEAKMKAMATAGGLVISDNPDHQADAAADAGGHAGHDGKEGGAIENYEFTNVVVNLAGTMGTRYLKTSFVVTGVKSTSVKTYFEMQKAKLTDITLNVLSSLTLADLEEPGSKNVIRDRLVTAYNQALGKRVVEQVYFSDFVVQ